jgi:hypothetical protein
MAQDLVVAGVNAALRKRKSWSTRGREGDQGHQVPGIL